MATFATLILMRKLDIEKRVYNLRLCEWEARGERPPRIPGTPGNKVQTGRWRGWEMVTVRKYTDIKGHVVSLDFHCGKWILHPCTHTLN